MIRKILIISLLGILSFTFPAISYAQDRTGIEAELGNVTITVSESTLHIQNAGGEILQIYNLIGMRVATYRIESQDVTLNASLQRGCYILKIGKVVRKVTIR